MIKALFLDLDDTLHSLRTYSLVRLKPVAQRLARETGLPEEKVYVRLCQYFDEGYRGDLLNRALKLYGLNEAAFLPELIALYRENPSRESLYADSLPFLEKARDGGFRLFLITDGIVSSQTPKVEKMGLGDFFDFWVCTGEGGPERAKPNPHYFLETARRFELVPEECLVVGDNPYRDFVELKQAGFPTLRVNRPDGRFTHVRLAEKYEAHREADSLEPIFAILEESRD